MTGRSGRKCQKLCLATFEKNLKWPLFDTKVFTVHLYNNFVSYELLKGTKSDRLVTFSICRHLHDKKVQMNLD